MTQPYIPCPGVVKVSWNMLAAGQPVVNTAHLYADVLWTTSALNNLAEEMKDFWHAQILPHLSQYTTLIDVKVTDLTTANSGVGEFPGDADPGGMTGAQAANNIAMCASLHTNARGRSFRGRMYFGGLPQSAVDNPISFTSTATDALRDGLDVLRTDTWTNGARWGVLTKYANKAARTEGFTTNIESVSVDTKIDSQRRRLGN